MNQKFKKVKSILNHEFDWLLENYSLEVFESVELKVYNSVEYNFSQDAQDYDSKEIDAFVTDNIENGKISVCIFVIYNPIHTPNDTDKLVLEKWAVSLDDLIFWILYHEFGHLFHFQQILKEGGIPSLNDFKEECENLLENILSKKEREEISEVEMDMEYRELWFEKYADEFANDIYNIRKDKLFLMKKMDF